LERLIGKKMKELITNTYKGKKVFITGHTGFKGSWLALWLSHLGADVTGYALKPNTNPSIFNEINLASKIHHIVGDIRDEAGLAEAVKKAQPEFVFHLAAQPLVSVSYDDPKYTFETNTMGLINLFEAVRKVDSVKVFVNVTSDKCYENMEKDYAYIETDKMGGYDPYSCSKGVSELITNSYRNSFFKDTDVALASARAGNVIGGGDWSKDRLVPDCVKALSENKDITIRNPIAVRPWQHVLDPLMGYLFLGAKMAKDNKKFNEGWNFGPKKDSVLNVEQIVSKVIENWGSGKYIVDGSQKFHEAKLLQLNIDKATKELGWTPVFDCNEAVAETVSWYKNFYDKTGSVYDFSINQIKSYMGKMS